MKSPYQMMSEYLESNPNATGYDIANFAKKEGFSYSSSGGGESDDPDEDTGKFVYSEEEWNALTEESTSETEKGADDDSF